MTAGAARRVAGCILAAGAGRRMGAPKGALAFAGRSFLEHLLVAFETTGIAPCFVVMASSNAEHQQALLDAHTARLLVNPDPDRGMLSSLHVCLNAIRADEAAGAARIDALVVAPVDCPRVRPATLAALVRAFAESDAPVVVPRFGGRRGHPTLFAARLFDELLQAPFDVGARAVVRAHVSDRLELDVDDAAVLDDIDSPAGLQALNGDSSNR